MMYHQKTSFVSIGPNSCILGHPAHSGDSSTQCHTLPSWPSIQSFTWQGLETLSLAGETNSAMTQYYWMLDIGWHAWYRFDPIYDWFFKLCRTSEFGIISCSSFTKLRLLLSIYVYMYVVVATSQIVWSLRPSSEGGQVRLPQELGHHRLSE